MAIKEAERVSSVTETQARVEIGEKRVRGVIQVMGFSPHSFLNFVLLRPGVLVVPILES